MSNNDKVIQILNDTLQRASEKGITLETKRSLEFFNDYVKFGCAEIDKDVFIRLGQLGQGLNHCNRVLESVTIGKGTFSKEQIKQIAGYYLNKK